MKEINRVVVIVLDGVGVGEAPDAEKYGDIGSNSVGNVSKVLGGIDLPNLGKIGLGHLTDLVGVPPTENPVGGFGKLTPLSSGKDTVSGHWEMMGIVLPEPFPTYPDGFPPEVIDKFEMLTGRGSLGNQVASGTVIIEELGEEHVRTGKPIIYTSADSVFQIAAHEDVIPIEQQYEICEIAREMLVGEHGVGRVIARPFVDDPENEGRKFVRTPRRKDFARIPETPTMMDRLVEGGLDVYTVGKIDDIFAHRGITKSNHTLNNAASTEALLEMLEMDFNGLLFVNLIEFDMIYGHRNDSAGYAAALKIFDDSINDIQSLLKPGDMVIVTGDHGVDPTTESTDHSREYVPLLVFGPKIGGRDLGVRGTLSDIAATIAEIFKLPQPLQGQSFYKQLLSD